MSLYTALVIIEVLFVVALVVALTRPHRKVKTKAKVLGAEFELESEEAAGAEQAAAAPAEPGTAAAAPGIAAEGIRTAGGWRCTTAPAAASTPAKWTPPAT
jgi:hypothetical protein